jgi:NitT/TauT family transport system substrate-binding protein
MAQIAKNPAEAAQLWVKNEHSKIPVAEIERMIRLPENEWTMVQKKIMDYAQFMSRVGLISAKPARWQDVFFDPIHKLPGS